MLIYRLGHSFFCKEPIEGYGAAFCAYLIFEQIVRRSV